MSPARNFHFVVFATLGTRSLHQAKFGLSIYFDKAIINKHLENKLNLFVIGVN
ncbi:hypothetical protein CYPRO_2529 [Cyclonatronum proteinivorum]|uniref:Uncharacterized protein n=1 Tax=Cyclonatronum proteinivorum TaxID=1457365 RepID=A0A345UMR9_9BACT|nr:hypothetical protein CYPRO_2529 [Cyclonatronum proteinivorum]